MKTSHFIIAIFIGSLFTTAACNTKKEEPVSEQPSLSTENPGMTTQGDTTMLNPAAVGSNATASSGHHFICPNACKGSGGAQAGKCPVCGAEYVHNDAFHQGQPIPEPAMKIDPVTNTAVPTHTEAQNAAGVYHFICPKGHAGGAGVAGNCPKCGTPLEHNQAFHQ